LEFDILTIDFEVKRSNIEAYNNLGVQSEKKEKYWEIVEHYNYGLVYSLVDKLIHVKGKKVCELGCGTAVHLKWYKRDCRQIVGLDISNKMLRLFLKTEGKAANFSPINADALTLPFKNDAFDLVTVYQSAHHFPNIFKCMSEMLRVSEGFAFMEPNKDSILHKLIEWRRVRHMMDVRFKSNDYELVEYNSAGFSAVQIRHYLRNKGVKVRVYYIFALPMEISAKIMRKSMIMFRLMSLFGRAFTYIPIVKSQFGGLLVVATREK
jgi:SAM-dependent methyltransferase